MKRIKRRQGKAEATQALYRQWCLLRHMTQRRKIGTQELCRRLADEDGLRVQLRTIQRDLNQLQNFFPLVCDGNNPAGWSWVEGARIEILPGMDPLTAFTFRLAATFLREMVPPSVREPLEPYFARADEILEKTSGLELGGWADKVSVLSRSDLLMAPSIDPKVHAAVCDALLHGRCCRITYASRSHGGKDEEHTIHPLGLVLVDKVVYLVATFEEYTDVRQLALHRVHSAEKLPERSSIPAGYSLKQYVESGQFRYILREGKITLKLRMAADRAAHLAETRLSVNQEITSAKDGYVLVEAEVADTHQLRFWLKGFGADLELLAPSYLRREMRREAQTLATLYSRSLRSKE